MKQNGYQVNPLLSPDKENAKVYISTSADHSKEGIRQLYLRVAIAAMICIAVAVIVPLVVFGVMSDQTTASDDSEPTQDNYLIWCIGECNHDVTTVTQPGAILIGGGVKSTRTQI